MTPIASTAEILYLRMLNSPTDKRWTAWAYDMLIAGFDTENLVILAGEMEPFNQFEMRPFADKVLKELNLKWDDRNMVLKNFASYLVDQVLLNKIDINVPLKILSDAYIELDYDSAFYDFFLLQNAKDDLEYSEMQWYWDGATRENINEIIRRYFEDWKKTYRIHGVS